jgi:hypothetical protein
MLTQNFDSPVTNKMILDMTKCVTYEVDRYAIARRVSEIFGKRLSDVIGFIDTEYKVLAVYVEINLQPDTPLKALADRYTIYAPYLLKRLQEFNDAIPTDIRVQAQVLRLNKEFSL